LRFAIPELPALSSITDLFYSVSGLFYPGAAYSRELSAIIGAAPDGRAP
jgi:hypothetical protein